VQIEGDWSVLRQPIVKGALAHLVCELYAEYPGGDHVIVVGHVLHARTDRDGEPLLYWRRGYRALGPAPGRQA
jgi:flavin reductase (DIM6/NTAB) family NADH-FMN oxidoreductase RutF